ncbi:hypothetical protein GMA8713_01535 [Grimontia marina]|uniref:Uncharacterized protein n=1 Tax=Grimontia marina TaxID=646534 RepID=A0A128F1G4_9GAMM|nr:hypothetical protein GMA8713_01535 [Grimontia marina]
MPVILIGFGVFRLFEYICSHWLGKGINNEMGNRIAIFRTDFSCNTSL